MTKGVRSPGGGLIGVAGSARIGDFVFFGHGGRDELKRVAAAPPQKIIPFPQKFSENVLCDIPEPSERRPYTCGTPFETSMLAISGLAGSRR